MRGRAVRLIHWWINVPQRRLGTLPPVVRHVHVIESMWQRGFSGCLSKLAGGEGIASFWEGLIEVDDAATRLIHPTVGPV